MEQSKIHCKIAKFKIHCKIVNCRNTCNYSKVKKKFITFIPAFFSQWKQKWKIIFLRRFRFVITGSFCGLIIFVCASLVIFFFIC